ncbi:hypothetical protein [Pseudomonas syringae]|uniref:hypothetical protein n=1 Tax=Pseudomonas syringae TaxID=317 RepID=UPI003204A3E4
MGISTERYQALLASGNAKIVRPESIRSPVIINPLDKYDFDAGENGIRIKAIGSTALSDSILALIIKNDQVIGVSTLEEDQLSISNARYVS